MAYKQLINDILAPYRCIPLFWDFYQINVFTYISNVLKTKIVFLNFTIYVSQT
jgi:hypothetical protein